jgi:DNA-binding winged helix-turn-helix (wHTH) protein/Tfp pilus assembly protein PilF
VTGTYSLVQVTGQTFHRSFVTGDWTVAPSRNLLMRGDEQIRVEPRVMDVLVLLLGRAGDVVSKEELVRGVWGERYVTDDVLTVTVYALRKALGDDARAPRYLETVPRRGYRWVAPVSVKEDAPAEPPEPDRERRRFDWRGAAAFAFAVVVIAAGAVWLSSASSRGRHVTTAESHEAYVKGRFFLDQRSVAGLQKAQEQFERAIALDPRNPAAHAGIADTYSSMADLGVASPAELRPRALASARRALELDPDSAEGHAAFGRAKFIFDWDFAAAERSLRHSIALDADSMPAHQALAWLESARGRHAEAIAEARHALQLDPVNTARYRELAWVLSLDGRTDDAVRELDRASQLAPGQPDEAAMKGWLLTLAERPDEAFSAYRDMLRISGANEATMKLAETTYRTEGIPGYYRRWLAHLRASNRLPLSNTWRAQLYLRAGDRNAALASLGDALRKHESALAWIHVDPGFEELRGDPRFVAIEKKVLAR